MENSIDVLYVHPTRSLDTTLYSFFPMGVVGLVNLIKSKGYSVYGINYGIEKSIDDNYSLIDELKNIDYKVLMLDLHWYEHAYGAIEIAKISKEINPSVPIIIGGITSTIFAKEIALLAFFSGVISFTNFFAKNG
jgi:clorobiocin biosynthesis protein CloN6